MADVSYTLRELAQKVNGVVHGDEAVVINRLSTLGEAQTGSLTFLSNPAYRALLTNTKASAVIVSQDDATSCPCAAIVVDNPYLAYATLSHLFKSGSDEPHIHPAAVIDPSAKTGESLCIHANVVIGANAVIGDRVFLGAGVVVGNDCVVGDDTVINANVTLYSDVRVGKRCIIHSGTVIGADGFGFANARGAWVKIAQLGGVRIGDDVEIGACVTIDRGALEHTIIEEGVKLDNQIQVAHNVKIGAHTAIAGCTGIAGSTSIGRYCIIAGGVGIVGHLTIADKVHITGMTMVTKSITEPGVYSSGVAALPDAQWKKNQARLRQLDDVVKRLNALERKEK